MYRRSISISVAEWHSGFGSVAAKAMPGMAPGVPDLLVPFSCRRELRSMDPVLGPYSSLPISTEWLFLYSRTTYPSRKLPWWGHGSKVRFMVSLSCSMDNDYCWQVSHPYRAQVSTYVVARVNRSDIYSSIALYIGYTRMLKSDSTHARKKYVFLCPVNPSADSRQISTRHRDVPASASYGTLYNDAARSHRWISYPRRWAWRIGCLLRVPWPSGLHRGIILLLYKRKDRVYYTNTIVYLIPVASVYHRRCNYGKSNSHAGVHLSNHSPGLAMLCCLAPQHIYWWSLRELWTFDLHSWFC